MCNDILSKTEKDMLSMTDEGYRAFHLKLVPTVNPEAVLGIRVPVLRAYADKLYKEGNYGVFLNALPHKYYDENQLHSFLICKIKDFDLCINEVERFLPFIDNWGVRDSLRPRCFKNNKDKLIIKILQWIKSDKPYTVRFAIEMLMCYYLEADFKEEYLMLVSDVRSEEYYVNMMIAWYFATALAKQYDKTIGYIENRKLPLWVHNKTIQKAVESYRISDEKKKLLKLYKIKN